MVYLNTRYYYSLAFNNDDIKLGGKVKQKIGMSTQKQKFCIPNGRKFKEINAVKGKWPDNFHPRDVTKVDI